MNLDPLVFKKVVAFIHTHMGITAPESNYTTIHRSVAERAFTLNKTPEDYVQYIEGNAEERQKFFNLMTINETYFFREEKQFIAIEKFLIPKLISETNQLKMWSVTCSSGEEPISLALLAQNFWGDTSGKTYSVYASDINTYVLEILKKGEYSSNSFRLDGKKYAFLLDSYGTKKDNHWQLLPSIQKKIIAFSANISNDRFDKVPNDISIALFRNTLIYIAQEKRAEVIQRIVSRIKEGGYLFMSASEVPLVSLPNLKIINYENTYFFQKVSSNLQKEKIETPPKKEVIISQTAKTVLPASVNFPSSRQILRASYDRSCNLPPSQTIDEKLERFVDLLLQILEHTDKNGLTVAREKIEELALKIGDNELVCYLKGFVYLAEKQIKDAVRFFKKSTDKDPDFWPAYFQLGKCLKDTQADIAQVALQKCHEKLLKCIEQKDFYFRILLDGFNENYFLELCDRWIVKIRQSSSIE